MVTINALPNVFVSNPTSLLVNTNNYGCRKFRSEKFDVFQKLRKR